MTWSDAKTSIESLIQNAGDTSEIEVDGHRQKKRSLKEIVDLEAYICDKAEEEANGPSNLKQAGFKVQAFNNGDGLI